MQAQPGKQAGDRQALWRSRASSVQRPGQGPSSRLTPSWPDCLKDLGELLERSLYSMPGSLCQASSLVVTSPALEVPQEVHFPLHTAT